MDMNELHKKLVAYFVSTNNVSTSERAIAAVATGYDATELDFKADITSVNRFFLMLKAIPELRDYLPGLADISDRWFVIIDNLSTIENMFINEAGLGFTLRVSAPKTYHYINSLLK